MKSVREIPEEKMSLASTRETTEELLIIQRRSRQDTIISQVIHTVEMSMEKVREISEESSSTEQRRNRNGTIISILAADEVRCLDNDEYKLDTSSKCNCINQLWHYVVHKVGSLCCNTQNEFDSYTGNSDKEHSSLAMQNFFREIRTIQVSDQSLSIKTLGKKIEYNIVRIKDNQVLGAFLHGIIAQASMEFISSQVNQSHDFSENFDDPVNKILAGLSKVPIVGDIANAAKMVKEKLQSMIRAQDANNVVYFFRTVTEVEEYFECVLGIYLGFNIEESTQRLKPVLDEQNSFIKKAISLKDHVMTVITSSEDAVTSKLTSNSKAHDPMVEYGKHVVAKIFEVIISGSPPGEYQSWASVKETEKICYLLEITSKVIDDIHSLSVISQPLKKEILEMYYNRSKCVEANDVLTSKRARLTRQASEDIDEQPIINSWAKEQNEILWLSWFGGDNNAAVDPMGSNDLECYEWPELSLS